MKEINYKYMPAGNLYMLGILSAIFIRWKLIASGLLLSVLSSIAAFFISPELFDANVMLEIGKYRVENRFEFLETPSIVAEKLILLAKTIKTGMHDNVNYPNFDIETDLFVTTEDHGFILIELHSPRTPKTLQFLQQLSNIIIKRHEKIFKLEHQKINKIIQNHKNEIKFLFEESQFIFRRKKILIGEKNALAEKLKQSKANLGETIQLISQLNEENKNIQIALMLFSKRKIQSFYTYINQIERRLYHLLPLEIENLQLKLKDLGRKKENIKVKLESSYMALDNTINTHILYKPYFPISSTSPDIKSLIIINVMSIGIPFMFIAFSVECYTRNKSRIKGCKSSAIRIKNGL